MIRWLTRILPFPLALAAVFYVFVSYGWGGGGRISQGMAVVARFLRWLLVEPMGLSGAMLFVFACGLFVAIGAARMGAADPGTAGDHGATDHDAVRQAEAAIDRIARAQLRSLDGPARIGKWAEMMIDNDQGFGRAARETLSVNGLDWYFAHYGYEGNWRHAVRELENEGDAALAQLLREAGPIYDRWTAIRVMRDDGEMTREETTAYFAELKPLDRRRIALFSSLG